MRPTCFGLIAPTQLLPRPPLQVLLVVPVTSPLASLPMWRRITQTHMSSIGTTFIYVTHDQEEALGLADRMIVMRDGRIEQAVASRQVYDAPANLWVAAFVGSSNQIAGIVRSVGAQIEIDSDVTRIVAEHAARRAACRRSRDRGRAAGGRRDLGILGRGRPGELRRCDDSRPAPTSSSPTSSSSPTPTSSRPPRGRTPRWRSSSPHSTRCTPSRPARTSARWAGDRRR